MVVLLMFGFHLWGFLTAMVFYLVLLDIVSEYGRIAARSSVGFFYGATRKQL
jgi:hypothetical protein